MSLMRGYGLRGNLISHRRTIAFSAAVISAITAMRSESARAASDTWDGNASIGIIGDGKNWTDPNNWTSNGVVDTSPQPGDDITFGNGTVGEILVDGSQTVGELTFNASFSLDAPPNSDSLFIQTGITVASKKSAVIGAGLAGNANITFGGAGDIFVAGANTFTGNLSLSGGTLLLDSSLALGTGSVASGSMLSLAADATAGDYTNNGSLMVGVVTTLTANSITQNAGTFSLQGGLKVNTFNDNGGTVAGSISLAGGSLAIGPAATGSGTFTFTANGGSISGPSGSTQFSIPSGMIVNFAPTTAATLTTQSENLNNAGILTLTRPTNFVTTLSLGSSSNTLTNTGSLTLNGSNVTTVNATNIVGNISNNAGGTLKINTVVNLNGNLTNSGNLNFSNEGITFNNSGDSFTQNAGTLTIGASSYVANVGGDFIFNGGKIVGNLILTDPVVSFGTDSTASGTISVYSGGSLGGSPGFTIPSTINLAVPEGLLNASTSFVNAGNFSIASYFNLDIFNAGSDSNTLTNTGTFTISSVSGSPTSFPKFIGSLNNTTGSVAISSSMLISGNITNASSFSIGSGVTEKFSSSAYSVTQTAGSMTIADGAVLDNSLGTFTLNGGSVLLNAGTTGGSIKVGSVVFSGTSGTPTISSTTPGSGQVSGFVDLGGNNVNFNIANGSAPVDLQISAPVTDGNLYKSGTGTLELDGINTNAYTEVDAGVLNVSHLANNSSVYVAGASTLYINPNSGAQTLNSLAIDSTAKLDITNNHLLINYTTSDPKSGLLSALAAGSNNGQWNGPQITSSTAAANSANYGVGFADGADGIAPGLSSGQIEIAYALLGDIKMNGVVNGLDFTILAQHFGTFVTGGWEQGDLNYDGVVNGADFSDLARNFGQTESGAAVALPASDWAALDSFAASNGLLADVPEPAVFSLVGLGLLGTLTRRRRRANSKI